MYKNKSMLKNKIEDKKDSTNACGGAVINSENIYILFGLLYTHRVFSP